MDDYWNEAKHLSKMTRNPHAVPSSEEIDEKGNRQQEYPPQVDQEQLQTVHRQNLPTHRHWAGFSADYRSALEDEELPRVGLHGWGLT